MLSYSYYADSSARECYLPRVHQLPVSLEFCAPIEVRARQFVSDSKLSPGKVALVLIAI